MSVNNDKTLKLWKLNTTGENYVWNVVENIPTEKDYVNDTDIEFNTTILPNLESVDNNRIKLFSQPDHVLLLANYNNYQIILSRYVLKTDQHLERSNYYRNKELLEIIPVFLLEIVVIVIKF